MKLNNKKKLTILIAITGLSMALNITSLASNSKLKKANSDYAVQVENLKEERDNTTKEIASTELKLEAQKTINEDEIKGVAESFLKSFYTYTYLTKDEIHQNIKPYSTEYLQKKLKPKSSENYNSDVDYVSTLDDIKLFYTAYEENSKATILAVSKHSIRVEGMGEPTNLITRLDITYTSDGWKVNDMVFSETFENYTSM